MTDEEQTAPEMSMELSHAEVARQIADQLGETEGLPRKQILHIVKAMGRTGARALLARTLEVEAQGGLIFKGAHRRTPGGTFFYLAYTIGTAKSGEKLRRFNVQARQGQSLPGKGQRARPPQLEISAARPAIKASGGEDRSVGIGATGGEKERTISAKITLIGKIEKCQRYGSYVVVSMQHTGGKLPALPKGIPAPAPTPTNYLVYVGTKQWRNVARAAVDKEDALIIGGYPQIDRENGAISVFADNVTSKKLQAARRQAQRAGNVGSEGSR